MLGFSLNAPPREDTPRDQPPVELTDIIENDPELFWRLAPNITLPDTSWPFFGVISNGQGLREDHEIPLQKAPDEIRLLFLGDSCTFGFLLPHTEAVAQQVEKELRRRFPGVSVECINAGVPGFSVFQGWRLLETEGAGYQPDLVIASFGWNDASVWDGLSDVEQYDAWQEVQPPAALRWSRLGQMLWGAMHPRVKPESASPERPRLLPEEFTALLEKVHLASRRQGADLLLLVPGARFNVDPAYAEDSRTRLQHEQSQYGQQIKFGPDGSAGYVDGASVVRQAAQTHSAEDLFFDTCHPTALANRIIAEAIAHKLEPWLSARIGRKTP